MFPSRNHPLFPAMKFESLAFLVRKYSPLVWAVWEVYLSTLFSLHNSPFCIIIRGPCAFLPHWFREFPPLFLRPRTCCRSGNEFPDTFGESHFARLWGQFESSSSNDGASCRNVLGFFCRILRGCSFLSVFSETVLSARKYLNDAEQVFSEFILGNPSRTMNHELPPYFSNEELE